MRNTIKLVTLLTCIWPLTFTVAKAACTNNCRQPGYVNPSWRPPCHQIVPAMDGPLELVVDYSDRYGWVFDPRYTHYLDAYNALYLEFAFGKSEFRAVSTWGTVVKDRQLFKLTLQYFAEEPTFFFPGSGVDSSWIGEYGIAAAYVVTLDPDSSLTNIHANLEYSHGKSDDLKDVTVGQTIFVRNVAPAEEYGATLGLRLEPWRNATWDLDLHYDTVRVNYSLTSNGKAIGGLGASVAYNQTLWEKLLLKLTSINRRPYYVWDAECRWILDTPPGVKLEIGAHVGYISRNVARPQETRYGIGIYYSWGGNPYYENRYGYESPLTGGLNQELVDWTSVPAMRPPQVLAKMEEVAR